MRRARSILLTLLLGAFVIRVLWLAIEPLAPNLLSAVVLITVLGFIYYRITQ